LFTGFTVYSIQEAGFVHSGETNTNSKQEADFIDTAWINIHFISWCSRNGNPHPPSVLQSLNQIPKKKQTLSTQRGPAFISWCSRNGNPRPPSVLQSPNQIPNKKQILSTQRGPAFISFLSAAAMEILILLQFFKV
jgi:hypothetical protein